MTAPGTVEPLNLRACLALAGEFLRLLIRRTAEPPSGDGGSLGSPADRPRLLVVSPYYVYPQTHGAAIRSFELVRRLQADCDVHILVAIGGSEDSAQRAFLAPWCRQVHFHQIVERDSRRRIFDFPDRAEMLASWSFVQRVQALSYCHDIDIVQLENSELGFLCDVPGAHRTVQVELDLTYRSIARRYRLREGILRVLRSAREVLQWLRFERTACTAADQVHVMSRSDRDILARLLPDGSRRIRVVPNGAAATGQMSFEAGSSDVLFVGSFPHYPNQEGLRFLVEEVWPRVRVRSESARLVVVGSRPPKWVLDLDGRDGVEVAGEVESMEPLYRRAGVAAVPILSGSGTRLKILEALAHGVPVVATSIGAEGLDALVDGKDLLLADSAEEFARQLWRVTTDGQLRARLAESGRRTVAERYSWDASANSALAGYRELSGTAAEDSAPRFLIEDPCDVEITIVIDARSPEANTEALVRALASQIEQRFELLWIVDQGIEIQIAPDSGIRCARLLELGAAAGDPGLGSRVRAAVRWARGAICVFLDGSLVPVGEQWLGDMTWPLFQPARPQGVEGVCLDAQGQRVSSSGVLSRRDGDRLVETRLSFRQSAVRKNYLSTIPVADDSELSSSMWGMLVEESGGWILREEKAVARVTQSRDGAGLRAPAIRPGRSSAASRASVVVSVGSDDVVDELLKSLEAQKLPDDVELFLIGSEVEKRLGSAARRAERLRSIRFVETSTTRSPAKWERGSRLASGGWVVFLDGGVVPQANWWEALEAAMTDGGPGAVVGPVDAELEGELPIWFTGECLVRCGVWSWFPQEGAIPLGRFHYGSNFAVRREHLASCDDFAWKVTHGSESFWSDAGWDQLLRIRERDVRVEVAGGARVRRRLGRGSLTRRSVESSFANAAVAQARLDWLRWGWSAASAGLLRRRELPDRSPRKGAWLTAVHADFVRAERRGYARGMLRAMLLVPRLERRARSGE